VGGCHLESKIINNFESNWPILMKNFQQTPDNNLQVEKGSNSEIKDGGNRHVKNWRSIITVKLTKLPWMEFSQQIHKTGLQTISTTASSHFSMTMSPVLSLTTKSHTSETLWPVFSINNAKQFFFTACNCVITSAHNNDEIVHLLLQESYCHHILTYGVAAMNDSYCKSI
jgi:hypothetical protein